jgi:imidazolonepropionase-like amidohydrolase
MPLPPPVLIENATLIDVARGAVQGEVHILVENGRIGGISSSPIRATGAARIDLKGRHVLPGLIDCHVHVTATRVDLGASAVLPDSYVTAVAAQVMKASLHAGFTTLRDLGGADHGLVQALDEGLIEGPRLVICGKALSQTGGHSDFRGRYDDRDDTWYARKLGAMGRIVDGVDAIRRACREEIKAGASFIKLMANGGVASPTDPIAFLGFSRDEIAAAVEEAANAQTYVAAHLYTDQAIRRAVELGVRSVEHANLIEKDTAELMARHGAFACPTVAVFEALRRDGARLGFPQTSIDKVETVRARGLEAVEILAKAGVKIAYGTDLIGELRAAPGLQASGFDLMAEVLGPAGVIRSATATAAELLNMQGQIGCLAEGAHADIIAIAGNPLEDVGLLSRGAVDLVMKGGAVFRNGLN